MYLGYELFRICELIRLTKLVIRVKHNSALLTPEVVALLVGLKDRLFDYLRGAVVFLHYE